MLPLTDKQFAVHTQGPLGKLPMLAENIFLVQSLAHRRSSTQSILNIKLK